MGNEKIIQQKTAEILSELAQTNPIKDGISPLDGHIFNLGHGISQFTAPEQVHFLIDTIQTESKKLRT
jgi:uroporphyrinogen decarboxylase